MTQTVGDFVVSRLYAWGVRRMFGYPGDGINGVFGALNRAGDKIEFIQARHEEMAAFMRLLTRNFPASSASVLRPQAQGRHIS
jgi:glyoxylate carboligase